MGRKQSRKDTEDEAVHVEEDVRDCIRQSSIACNLRPPPTSRAAGTVPLCRASSSAGLNVRQRVQLRKQSTKGLFGRAPAPPKTAPALAPLVERLF
jgi:hypothetical protein